MAITITAYNWNGDSIGIDVKAYLADFDENYAPVGFGWFSSDPSDFSGNQYATTEQSNLIANPGFQAAVAESGGGGNSIEYDFATHIVGGDLDAISFGYGVTYKSSTDTFPLTRLDLRISALGIVNQSGSGNIVSKVLNDLRTGAVGNIESLLSASAINFVGSTGNDKFIGYSHGDTLKGGGGNDILDGGAGSDRMEGGAGDDTYYVDSAGDVVKEALGSGTDKVFASVSFSLTSNVENLELTGAGNIDGTGNSLKNEVIGNSGNNVLDGKGGADTMKGGAGDDTYYVDHAGDVVKETASADTDKVFASVSFALTSNVENLELTGTANIDGTGNSLKNEMIGNSGNNVLDGKGGADNMKGGAGDDTYYVDNAGDVVKETANAGTDKIFSKISYTVAANTENLELIGNANIDGTGNAVANVITGNAGNNVLDGKGGSDTMVGGAESDAFVFSTALNAATNVDTIVDFVVADDTIMLSQRIFSGLSVGTLPSDAFHIGAAAADASDRIIYDSSTGDLFYDADGSGGGAAVKFAILSTGLALTQDDFIIV